MKILARRKVRKLFGRKVAELHETAQEIQARQSIYDYEAEWKRKRDDTSLPPEERFAGEAWYERAKGTVLSFPKKA